jgi:hypothetical protein
MVPSSFLSSRYRNLSPRRVKQQGRESDYSLPSNVEVNNGRVCVHFLISLHGVCLFKKQS